MKFRTKSLLLFLALLFVSKVNATILFSDDFESDLSQWQSNISGVIVPDPIEGDSALSFTSVVFGGDIFSPLLNNPYGGQYILSFDYLGTCNDNCGGFIGYTLAIPG